jgi:hypothetical protein
VSDAPGDLIAVVSRVVKFDIGGGSRRASNVLAIHPDDERNERSREGKSRKYIAALIVKRRIVERDEANVVGAGPQSDVADCVSAEVYGVRRGG